jgi:glutamate synthase domain-containing protein 3
MQMVQLERLAEAEDLEFVRGLLGHHQRYTGSTVAERLLANWPQSVERFVKVMPTEYRRVLNEQLAAAQTHTVAASANVEVAARG